MQIHLLTVIGSDVKVLPHMLRHYGRMGIDSFLINVNLDHADDPIMDDVREALAEHDIEVSRIQIGPWNNDVNTRLYAESKENPDDWYIIADLDEFQEYPSDLREIIEQCEDKGYDYIEGCFIDRIAADGGFPEITSDSPLDEQFPLGCTFTHRILGGYPLKVVAAKGKVEVSVGNHNANGGVPCPVEECFVQVHHYKWDQSVVSRMWKRARNRDLGVYMLACRRFVDYFQVNNGRIDVSDPRLLVAECNPQYKYWNFIKEEVQSYPNRPGHIARRPSLSAR